MSVLGFKVLPGSGVASIGVVYLGSPGALSEVMTTRSAEIAVAVASAVAGRVVPSSALLAAEYERGGFLREPIIARVLELASAGELFTDDDLGTLRGIGAGFADHHVPLSLLTTSFDVGITAMTRESWHIAPAEGFADMAQFTESLARLVEQGRQAAVRGYMEARAGSDSRSASRVAAEELIGGECTPEAVQAIGVKLAPGYLVLACAVPDPAGIGAGQVAAIHRDIEGIPGALHCGDLSALVVLLPVEDARQPPGATAAELASRLRTLAGQVVYAAQAHRPDLAGIPAALEEANRALSLVKAIPDAGCRPYRMDDLLVELAIARQPDIRRRLADLLTPLDGGADLRRTLKALFACDLDRERAARELGIHRRTLRYRMDRIQDLSGIDPDSAHGIQLLRAALTAVHLPAQRSPEPETASPPSP